MRRRLVWPAAALAGVVLSGGTRSAVSPQCDRDATFTEPDVPKPAYLRPITDPTFGTTVVRIAGDSGTAFTNDSLPQQPTALPCETIVVAPVRTAQGLRWRIWDGGAGTRLP